MTTEIYNFVLTDNFIDEIIGSPEGLSRLRAVFTEMQKQGTATLPFEDMDVTLNMASWRGLLEGLSTRESAERYHADTSRTVVLRCRKAARGNFTAPGASLITTTTDANIGAVDVREVFMLAATATGGDAKAASAYVHASSGIAMITTVVGLATKGGSEPLH